MASCGGKGEVESEQRMSPLLLHVAAFMAICRVSPIIMTNRFTAPPDLALFHVTFAHGMDSIKSKDPTPFPTLLSPPSRFSILAANVNLGQAIKLADILGSIYIVVGSQYTI